MNSFNYIVTVEAETKEQADMVMAYRCGHDEEIEPEDGGPFDYKIYWQNMR